MTDMRIFEGPIARTLNTLAVTLNHVDYACREQSPELTAVQESLLQKCNPHTHLIVYGSLAPGKINHKQIVQIRGRYFHGSIQGTLIQAGWGEHLGFPGLIWGMDALAERIPVQVLQARELPQHWTRLDAFEGQAYRRIVIPFLLNSGTWGLGCVYHLNPASQ